jgi:hypothetical protein
MRETKQMGVFQQPANLQEELWRGEPGKIGGKAAILDEGMEKGSKLSQQVLCDVIFGKLS